MARTAEIDIDADIEAVWRHLTTPELMGTWMPGVDNLRTADGGTLEPGTLLLFEARGQTRESIVSTCEPTSLMILTSAQGAFTATYRYTLARRGAGTRLALTISCVATGPARLFAPLIRYLMWKSDSSQPQRIRDTVMAR